MADHTSIPNQHICLNMIVKNERNVIERCLASVRSIISSWAIVDTGSEDGTQEVIKAYLKDLPGKLVERPWKDFARNRTEALQYVPKSATYILIIDADEVLRYEPGFTMPELDHDCYHIQSRLPNMHYYRTQLVKNGLQWRWESKLHEYIISDISQPPVPLQGLYNQPHPDGFRSSNPHKYKQDALTLEQAVLEEPDNPRYVFYLAQSYRDCDDHELAIRHYSQRVRMQGWQEEVWYSLYQIALLKAKKGETWETVQMSLLDAFNYRPSRAEPLLTLAEYYLSKNAWPLAYLFAHQATMIPYPQDVLFIEDGAYGPKLWLTYAHSLLGLGRFEEVVAVCNTILSSSERKPEISQEAIKTRKAAMDGLVPKRKESLQETHAIHVIVHCASIHHALDNCVLSLLQQDHPDLRITCVTYGELEAPLRQHLSSLDQVHVQIGDLNKALATTAENEWALVLEAHTWLHHQHAISELNDVLNERDTSLVYGAHHNTMRGYGKVPAHTTMVFKEERVQWVESPSWLLFKPVKISIDDELEPSLQHLTERLFAMEKKTFNAYFLEGAPFCSDDHIKHNSTPNRVMKEAST